MQPASHPFIGLVQYANGTAGFQWTDSLTGACRVRSPYIHRVTVYVPVYGVNVFYVFADALYDL